MSENSRHTFKPFGNALEEMQTHILTMASLTATNLENSVKALLEKDDALCREVKKADDAVDDFEVKIDSDAQGILAQFSPVATDLRSVISTMKVSNSLERISDYAVNISKRALKMNAAPPVEETSLIEPIFDLTFQIFSDALTAFRTRDADLAITLKKRDKDLDRENKAFSHKMTKCMQADPGNVKSYLDLIFISRFLERVGDQAVNIGEDTIFLASAEDIRHQ